MYANLFMKICIIASHNKKIVILSRIDKKTNVFPKGHVKTKTILCRSDKKMIFTGIDLKKFALSQVTTKK
jgi:hypothetical protein